MSIMLPTLLEAIQEGMSRGWTLLLDGKPVADVSSLVLFNPRFGSLFYGKSPSGNYDQWSFHEVGGGGAVNMPYSIIEGNLYVGVVEQNRPLQDKVQPILNVPRGFMDPEETHFETAVREVEEEAGVQGAKRKTTLLPGVSGNPNNAFFETWGDGEGVAFYCLEIVLDELKKSDEDDYYVLNEKVVTPVSKAAEGIMGSRFIPWTEAAKLGDMMTLSALSRLLVYLFSEGKFRQLNQHSD
jgi:8-oxo-dGTP pyrophosphatase MutT (NUDIX family)